MTDLHPCPHCGGKASRQEIDSSIDAVPEDPNFGGSYIECDNCGACTKLHFGRKEDLVPSWNRRSSGSPMDTAPRNGMPILVWCDHDADPYFMPDDKRLTTYGEHVEGLSQHVPTGWAIVVWGGEYYHDDDGYTPPWWFLHDGDWEMPANPVKWWPLPMEAA